MAVHADAVSDGRVRVEEIAEIIVDVVDDGFRFIVVNPAAFKFLAQRLQFVSRYAHLPRFQEVLFPLGHFGGIFFGDVEQEAFKIARQEDVHGRARRRVEVAVHVIDAGFKEVGQDLVLVRCANQLADRHAHLLGKIASQDIAEVPRRDDDIERFAFADGAVIDEGDIRRYVVGDLREQAADVDGIGAGEEDTLVVGIGVDFSASKDAFQKALGVIEIAINGRYLDVIPFLLLHLLLLHGADAFAGIKDHDIRTGHVLEAFQGGLARITAGRRQDEDIPVLFFLLLGSRQ